MNKKDFGFGTQIRKSPYFDATVRWGAKDFSVYNHMYIPRDFGDPEENFWNLKMRNSRGMLMKEISHPSWIMKL